MARHLEYRRCVLGVFRNSQGGVLVCERMDAPGHWQLPQGGVDSGETEQQAIEREMFEELGTNQFKNLRMATACVSYDFPSNLTKFIAHKYRGQTQRWFLMEFENGVEPNLEKALTKEFSQWRWVSVQEAIDRVIDWKKEAYKQGFTLLDMI